MFSWLANAWRVPELRHRVLFTGMILALYRLGSWIPAPGVDSASIQSYFNNKGGTLRALGLGKIGRSVERDESPQLAGMLRKVRHLVRVDSDA